MLQKNTVAGGQEDSGIEPATLWFVDDLLYLRSLSLLLNPPPHTLPPPPPPPPPPPSEQPAPHQQLAGNPEPSHSRLAPAPEEAAGKLSNGMRKSTKRQLSQISWRRFREHVQVRMDAPRDCSGNSPLMERREKALLTEKSPRLCHRRVGTLSWENSQPVCDPTRLLCVVLVQNRPAPPLTNITSLARTTTERHGSNYSSRHGNMQRWSPI
ncbi:unnamed protein product [Pleuronectes platessa]|uniref:Uncharacterized protein n=1 Tax=Pleuronectes platessa TaxID=8262 RepID=A0A9N7Y1Z9_PLEPL|nr:unnamed protein product [Pleuronectes platessa]